MERVSIGDFPIALAQAALGASGAIEIGMSPFHPDWIEYVEDMAQLVDSRLLRRMLLPGYSDFGWSRPDDALPSEASLGRLRPFLENGWEVRTAPYSRLGFAVIVDRERAFHAYPSGRRGRRDGDVPEVTERVGDRELAEFLSEFDHGWSVGSPFVPIYSDPQSVDLSETELLLRVEISDDQFRDLIQYLARNPERMREMDPRRFEEFVADLFAREGFDVELTPLSGDGGRDILVSSVSDLGPMLHLVECKRYGEEHPVGVSLLRSLYGVVEEHRATGGILVTTTRLTGPALEFVSKMPHRLAKKEYKDVVEWIGRHTA